MTLSMEGSADARRTTDLAVGETEHRAAIHLPPKPPEEHQTSADVIDFLCARLGATYFRRPDGADVVIGLVEKDGDTHTGRGANNREALARLVKKLRQVANLQDLPLQPGEEA